MFEGESLGCFSGLANSTSHSANAKRAEAGESPTKGSELGFEPGVLSLDLVKLREKFRANAVVGLCGLLSLKRSIVGGQGILACLCSLLRLMESLYRSVAVSLRPVAMLLVDLDLGPCLCRFVVGAGCASSAVERQRVSVDRLAETESIPSRVPLRPEASRGTLNRNSRLANGLRNWIRCYTSVRKK